METEKWKTIDNFDNYEISNFGRLKNKKTKTILKGSVASGYRTYSLTNSEETKKHFAHRLVAEQFIPNPENKEEVNHLGDKDDNRVCMLEWTTRCENMQHASTFIIERRKIEIFALDPETREIVDSFETTREASFCAGSFPKLKKFINTDQVYKKYLWISKDQEKEEEEIIEGEKWVKTEDSIYPELNKYKNYQVSDYGRVRGQKGNIMAVNYSSTRGRIQLGVNGNHEHFTVYQLVLMAFNVVNPDPENKNTIDHIDSNPLNNKLDNLRWASAKEQVDNENTRIKNSRPKMGLRKTVLITDLDGNTEIIYGVGEVAKRLEMPRMYVSGYAQSGKSYDGYTIKYLDGLIIDEKKNAERSEVLRLALEKASQPKEKVVHKEYSKRPIEEVRIKTIKITDKEGTVVIHRGLKDLERKLCVTRDTIHKYSKSGKIFAGLKFEICSKTEDANYDKNDDDLDRLVWERKGKGKVGKANQKPKTKITVTCPNGEIKKYEGIVKLAKELKFCYGTVKKYADSGESYKDYYFSIEEQ